MTCDELLIALNEVVDSETALEIYKEFAAHLSNCNPCQVVLDNIRQTITLFQAGQEYHMPPSFQEKYQQIIESKWDEKFHKSKNEKNS